MANSHDPAQRILLSILGLVGIVLMLVATNVIPTPDEKFHAPRWVLFVCGCVFALPGIASFFPSNSRAARMLIALMIAGLGIVGIAAGWTAEKENLHGGLPFVSDETNLMIGRIAFIGGGIFCFSCSLACALGYGTVLGDDNHETDEEDQG